MVLTLAQKSLVWIFLFRLCSTQNEDVDTQTLARIVQTLENQLGQFGQYAIAFRVERENCLTNSSYSGEDLITDGVKNTIRNNEVYVSNNLIAAKALKGINTKHSEFRLKNYLKKVLNMSDKCVIYFTVSSPCLTRCLAENGRYTIRGSLTSLQAYQGIKAFAFKKIWEHDSEEELIRRLRGIAPNLPSYQFRRNPVCIRLYNLKSQTHENDMTILNL